MDARHVIIGVDVCASTDMQHPVCSIRRAGGGMYRVLVASEPVLRDPVTNEVLNRHDFDTLDEALEYADGICWFVDLDPALTNPHSVHANAQVGQANEAMVAHEQAIAAERVTHAKELAKLQEQIDKLSAKA